MKTPPPREPQFQFVQWLASGILQLILGLDSNARLRRGHKLHADLLAPDGVAGAERCGTPRRTDRRRSQRRRQKPARMHLNAQTALIVSGKSQEQKQRVKVYGRLL